MRKESLAGLGAEHRKPRNNDREPVFGPKASEHDAPDPVAADRILNAQILQSLRDQRRNHDASGSIAGEIIRLATLAAGLQRAGTLTSVAGHPSGIAVAMNTLDSVVGCDQEPSAEDAA